MELQFRVADAYLAGYRNTFLGLSIIPMEETGIEMMFRIQERAPGSPLAERQLARSADYYYRSSQFDLAADAYGAFIRFFPRSPLVPRARLRQAYSNFAQFRGPRYDATPLLDARAQFLDILARDPEMAREEGVRQFIDRIEEQLAAKIFIDASYYEVACINPKAAVFSLPDGGSAISEFPRGAGGPTGVAKDAALGTDRPAPAATGRPVAAHPAVDGREMSVGIPSQASR